MVGLLWWRLDQPQTSPAPLAWFMLHCTIWERVQEEGGCTARLSHAIKACQMAFSFILTNVHVRNAWLCSNRLTFWAEDLGIEATGESERSGQRAGMGSQLRMAEPA